MELGLAHFRMVVDSVVRLHNFCRDRKVALPPDNAGNSSVPAGIEFDDDGALESDYLQPEMGRVGRPLKDQAAASRTRNAIRQELEIQGIMRPAHNLTRNRNRST